MGDLRRLRRDGGLLLATTAVVAGVLALVHPAWLMLVPLIVGGTALIARPTYNRRAQRVRTDLGAPIPLVAC